MTVLTNGNTGLAIKIIKCYTISPEKGRKCKYILYNKKNKIVYEAKSKYLSHKLWKWDDR